MGCTLAPPAHRNTQGEYTGQWRFDIRNKRSGLVVFWIGALYIIAMGFLASFWARGAYRYLSIDEVRQTIWATTSPLFGLWASSVGIGAILAGVGILLYARSKGWRIWLFGIGVFVVLLIDMLSRWPTLPAPGHFPPLFGLGGGLIVAFFLGILWFWAKKHMVLESPAKTAAEYQLTGYVFFLIAMWYLCGELAWPFQEALKDLPRMSPVAIIAYLVLGWLFLFLSHWKSAQAIRK